MCHWQNSNLLSFFVEYPVIGKYGQHKFYMYEGEGQRKQNEERKYLYDMERRVEKHHK
jgi:hypothetical protein